VISSMLRSDRTTVHGDHVSVTDAPCDPKPVQDRLPLLVGAKGEQRGLRIAARHADEWNSWADPDTFRHRSEVLDRRCEEIGRDPGEIRRSTQALLLLSDDEDWLAARRADGTGGRPVMIGTAEQVAEVVADYAQSGVDELIIPDWTMGSSARRIETCDRFIEQVAPAFR
jgi:alkanesulfonate monooxygenase SsuD/methylene tetrahydromethanopterin reductase-like flavin-dependent oxidoreductase (luciferase family)